MFYFINIFFNLSLGNMLINLDNMLIFFSKRASGMLINDMLIKKKHVSQLVYMPNFRAIGQSVWEKNGNRQKHTHTQKHTQTHLNFIKIDSNELIV